MGEPENGKTSTFVPWLVVFACLTGMAYFAFTTKQENAILGHYQAESATRFIAQELYFRDDGVCEMKQWAAKEDITSNWKVEKNGKYREVIVTMQKKAGGQYPTFF